MCTAGFRWKEDTTSVFTQIKLWIESFMHQAPGVYPSFYPVCIWVTALTSVYMFPLAIISHLAINELFFCFRKLWFQWFAFSITRLFVEAELSVKTRWNVRFCTYGLFWQRSWEKHFSDFFLFVQVHPLNIVLFAIFSSVEKPSAVETHAQPSRLSGSSSSSDSSSSSSSSSSSDSSDSDSSWDC